MQDENDLSGMLTPAERELETALGGIAPSAARRRDELMFKAGARSARRAMRVWRSATVALAACIGIVMFVRRETPAPQIVRNEPMSIIGPRAPAAISAAERGPFTLASLNYLVLEKGVDALPSGAEATDRAAPSATPSLRRYRSTERTPGDPL
jgi:hypothetical protein